MTNCLYQFLVIELHYVIYFFLFQHFIGERKVDEDLSRTTRFLYDSDHLKEASILNIVLK